MSRIILFLSLLVVPNGTMAITPLPEVFNVVASQCSSPPVRRHQTGFFMQGYRGLITALHGVLGCADIIASRETDAVIISDLKIAAVDITNDIVLLRSSKPAVVHVAGLVKGDIPSGSALLTIVGHPLALADQYHMKLTLEDPAKQLVKLIPPDAPVRELKDRGSPAIDIPVLSVTGFMQPGHSGAPILNTAGRLVGIGSGGLRGGTAGIGWGIRIDTIHFRAANAVRQDLNRLAKLKAELVFVFPLEHSWTEGSGLISCEEVINTEQWWECKRLGSSIVKVKANCPERSLEEWWRCQRGN